MEQKIERIQILTLAESDFPPDFDLQTIQTNYLLNELPILKLGKFYYNNKMVAEPQNNLILFQYKLQIIGFGKSVLRVDIEKYLQFDPDTIGIFSPPISKEEMTKIWANYSGHQRSQQILDIAFHNDFFETFNSRIITVHDDIENVFLKSVESNVNKSNTFEDKPKNIENKKSYSGYAHKRSSTASSNALVHSNFLCEYNNEHNTFSSKITGENFVEAHHLIPLKHQAEFDYSLDIEANIVSLCPNCHKLLHFGLFKDKKNMIEVLWNKRYTRLEKVGLQIKLDKLFQIYK